MSVMITKECINCDACAPECPVAAIMSDSDEKNPFEGERYYVKPEACVECVGHADQPRCAAACPTEGSIVWDMPYNEEFNDYYVSGHEAGSYKIREHKKKGFMFPTVKAQEFMSEIPMSARQSHAHVAASF